MEMVENKLSKVVPFIPLFVFFSPIVHAAIPLSIYKCKVNAL